MIIDFHTHVFPDKIAHSTIDALSSRASIKPYSDGTVAGLVDKLKKADVSVSINLPVLTNPTRFESVNLYSKTLNEQFADSNPKIISFAGIHPACDGLEEKMEWIKAQGFLGVKIHPDYQETFFDDERYVTILQCAKELDLIVVTHAGFDVGYPDSPIRCTPERARRVIEKVGHSKLVLAHLGGNCLTDDVISTLCGLDVYFDTAVVLESTSRETFCKVLEKHGEDKILFASDSPWSDIAADTDRIRAYKLEKATEEKIFCGNAKALLGI